MPRDYKGRATAKAKPGKRASGWLYFLAGMAVGLLATALVWLKLAPPETEGSRSQAGSTVSRQKQPETRKAEVPRGEDSTPRPRFDFYTILPEMEVVVPEPEPQPPAGDRRMEQKTTPATAVSGRYMLQMGSFRRYADADRLKASLALVGIEAEIQKVSVNDGEIFHRVRSGPYSREQANALRSRLRQNRINSLVIRLK